MAEIVYILCAVLSMACAAALLISYRRTQARLLLWTGLGFLGIGVNNVLVVFDLMVFVEHDFSWVRGITTLAGMCCLLYGLIWDA